MGKEVWNFRGSYRPRHHPYCRYRLYFKIQQKRVSKISNTQLNEFHILNNCLPVRFCSPNGVLKANQNQTHETERFFFMWPINITNYSFKTESEVFTGTSQDETLQNPNVQG